MPQPSEREIEIFNAALELPAGERAVYLGEACAGDAALLQRVEELLRATEKAGDFLEASPPGLDPKRTVRVNIPLTEKPGDRIGRYKLLQQIGEGGCGVVYMAEQEEPVRRRVALKVIKLGMDTKSVIARFEAERQALALMDHPNIAKVLDAGATDAGRPYFVMELVRGIKITEYCDQSKLSTRERLDLFMQICRAIQHAHQKGIIHRDIKPSNILVTVNDGVPVPKVIDFGIAKAAQGRLTDKTLFTAFEQFIGTPAYMSPEQAMMTSLDIDTRSDIYSLGVLLYELLTGKTPFDADELFRSGLDAMRRTIREIEPPKPSTRLSTMLDAERSVTATDRQTDPPRLIHLVRGDLDWIVMKALEKDRTRRYETANGLAVDIQRHLKNEPVVARPPGNLYRFQKLVRRNKLAFAAAAAISTVLLLGVMVSTSEAIRAKLAEREQIQLRQQAEADETKARTEAAKATAISDFLQQSLRSANPDELKGSEYTVRQLLDDFSAGLNNQFRDQPEVEAAVRATLGQTYYRLGLADKSQVQMEQALILRRRIFGTNELVAETLVAYAWTSFEQQQFARGESQAREALDIYRKRGTIGRPVIAALWVLQEILNSQGRFTDVESVTEEALDIAGKTPAVEYPETASLIHGLAQAKISQSKFPEAEVLSRQAVEMHRRLQGAEHPETGWALVALGRALLDEKKFDEAESACREALSIFRKQYSFGHKSVDTAMSELKDVLVAKADLPGLLAFYQDTLAEQRVALGNDSPAVAETLMNLSDALRSQGKQAEAENASREALDINLKGNGPITANLPALVQRQAQVLYARGESPEAEKIFEQAINGARLKLGETNPILGELLHDYGEFLGHENKFEAAAEYHLKSLPIRRAQPDDNLAWTLRDLGGELVLIGRPQEAETYLRESLALYRKMHQQEDINGTAWTTERLGYALYQQHKLPEAEQAYRQALAACTNCQAVGSDEYAAVVRSLLDVLKAENKLAEGEALCREILAQQLAAFTNDSPVVAETMSTLADNLAAQGKRAEAEKALREALRMFQQSTGTNPASSDDLTRLGHLQWQLGQLLTDRQQSGEAEQLYQEALEVFEKASQDFPREPFLRQEQAFSHRLLGQLMESPGRWDESERHYRAAISLYAALVAEQPQSPFYLSEESYTIWMLALVLDRAGHTDQAAEEFRKAAALHEKGVADFPNEEGFKSRLLSIRLGLGELLLKNKNYHGAEEAYRAALRDYPQGRPADMDEYTRIVRALVAVLKLENKPAEAEALMKEALTQQMQLSGTPNAAVLGALLNLADFLNSENKPEEAAKTYREALDLIPKLGPEDQAKLPSLVMNLAESLRSQGRTRDAEKLYEELIPIERQKLGATNAVLGDLYRNFAYLLFYQEDKPEPAVEQYLKSLSIRRAITNDDLVTTLRELGDALVTADKPKEGESHLREALALFRTLHSKDDIHGTGDALYKLGEATSDQEKWAEAEQFYRDAMAAYANCQGVGGAGYTRSARSLVQLLKSRNRPAEAEKVLNDVLSNERQSLGERDITVAITLLDLADLLQAQNQTNEAARHFWEALNVVSNTPAAAKNATWLNNVSWDLVTAENPSGWDASVAVALAQKAVEASEGKTPFILDTLAAAYSLAGQFTNAVRVEQAAIDLLQDGEEKADYATRLRLYQSNTPYRDHARLAEMTLVLLDAGKFAKAEPLARACLALRETEIPDNWRTFNARSLLGGSLLGQKKYAEAEPLLLSGYEGLKQHEDQIPPAGKVRLPQAIQRLVQLYEETGRPGLAADWKKKLAGLDSNKR